MRAERGQVGPGPEVISQLVWSPEAQWHVAMRRRGMSDF